MTHTQGKSIHQFIQDFENRKETGHLAHELGAGQSCNKCKEKCSGFDLHFWRKICKNCKCGKEAHGVTEDENFKIYRFGKLFGSNASHLGSTDIVKELNDNLKISDGDTINDNETSASVTYDWIPPNIDSHLVEKYMKNLPSNHQPISGSLGAVHRRQMIESQLPLHDLDSNHCHDLSDQEIKTMNEFIATCRQHVGVGSIDEYDSKLHNTVCTNCKNNFETGDVILHTKHLGLKYAWHQNCFECANCSNHLADLIYFSKQNSIFCGRHFAETQYDRCAACDELIFTKQYTNAEGKNWHIKHFCCYDCDVPLAGKKYVPSDDGNPHCINCYAQRCNGCSSMIAVEEKHISYQGLSWHASDDCFKCSSCAAALLGQRFLVKEIFIFCSVPCKKLKFPA